MNINKNIITKNQGLNVTSTSGIQTNASVGQTAVEDILDEIYRSEKTSYATITLYLLMITPLAMYNKYKF